MTTVVIAFYKLSNLCKMQRYSFFMNYTNFSVNYCARHISHLWQSSVTFSPKYSMSMRSRQVSVSVMYCIILLMRSLSFSRSFSYTSSLIVSLSETTRWRRYVIVGMRLGGR